jgi:glycopeptide antibiotics resistance protein
MDFKHVSFVINVSMILLFGLVWFSVIAFLRLKKKKSLVYLLFFTIFYVYLIKVLDYTLFQFQSLVLLKYFTPGLMLNGLAAGKSINVIPLITLTLNDVKTSLLNILLFIPFGFGLPFITDLRIKRIIGIGALFSIIIELLQLITGLMAKTTFRITDVNDVIFNVIGVASGYVLFVGFVRVYRHVSRNWKLSANLISRHIAERPQIDKQRVKSKNIIFTAIIIGVVAAFSGYAVYQENQLEVNIGAGPSLGTTQPAPETVSVSSNIVRVPFDSRELFADETQKTSFTDEKTGDVVSLKLLTDMAHQARNLTYDVEVKGKVIGQAGGQGLSMFGFSPNGKYFAFRSRSVLGCAAMCQDREMYLIDLETLEVKFLSTPSLGEGNAVNKDREYSDVEEVIDNYSWMDDSEMDITAYAVGLGTDNLYRITPKQVWRYDLTTGMFTLLRTLPE